MHKPLFAIILALGIGSLATTHAQQAPTAASPTPAAINDAQAAYKSGDHRLIGVYGISVEVPGLAGNPYDHKDEIRMLDGTGDAFCTDEEQTLNHNARLYAKRYNEAMLNRLRIDTPSKF